MGVGNPPARDYPLLMWIQRVHQVLRSRHRQTQVDGPVKNFAAVSVLMVDDAVLFIRRSVAKNDPWSGHMAFPGGRMDKSDADLEQTARREVMEEIGLDLTGASLLGVLDDVETPPNVPRVCVTPFVFALPSVPTFELDQTEVAAVYWYDFDGLVRGDGRGDFAYIHKGVNLRLPCIDQGDRRVWGMTLRIVDDLLARLGIVHS